MSVIFHDGHVDSMLRYLFALRLESGKKSPQIIFPPSSEVLLCHLAHFYSPVSRFFPPFLNVSGKECVSDDKHSMKMGPCDRTGFPISRSWMGEPRSSCLTKPRV